MPARLLVLNGANGNILFDHLFGTTLNQRGDRAAVLKDIDTNGVNEFLGGNREGKVICFYGGNGTITSVIAGSTAAGDYRLDQNYPNPFNPSTAITFELPKAGHVRITVFDAMGREVDEIVNERLDKGVYETKFNGSNLPSGVYYYRLASAGFSDTRKMLLIK